MKNTIFWKTLAWRCVNSFDIESLLLLSMEKGGLTEYTMYD